MMQVLYIYESNLIAKEYCLFVQKNVVRLLL